MRNLLLPDMRALRVVMIAFVAWAFGMTSAHAQETVSISVAAGISFSVTDVTRDTAGSPSPTSVSFSDAALDPGKALRLSVQADAAAFTPPSGSSIPAEKVSWTSGGASGGIGTDGTLSSSSYTLVFQSDPSVTSGHVDLSWTLAAPGSGIRAGTHRLTIRWKVESITP